MNTDKIHDNAAKLLDEVIDAKNSTSESIDAAGEKISAIRDRAVEALDAFAERANHWARKSIDKASRAQQCARQELEKASDATAAYVERQPLKSVAIAAGIGAAAAALIILLSHNHRKH